MVEPGLEFGAEDFRRGVYAEVKGVLDSIYATHGKGAWKTKILINDRIADSIFQQVVTRADEYSVLACPNLNGDYISDACAAQVGGLGIAPGANIGDELRHLRSDARHRSQVCGQGRHQSRLGHSVRRHDVGFHGLDRGCTADRRQHGAHHPAKEGYL